jgi:LDH2 family malate/lactate/ureidoglycolate dehydrogenase
LGEAAQFRKWSENDVPGTSKLIANPEQLRRWAASVFRSLQVSEEAAQETARILVRTDLRGIDTHGVVRIPHYVQKLRSGEVNGSAQPSEEFHDGLLRYDGNGGIGQSVATSAIRRCVELARDRPFLVCLLRRSGHLAAIGQFVLEAAEAGMVAFICQETPPLMGPRGARGPAIGNNPIAFAAPVPKGPPLLFDMATSVVARGNILQAVRDGAPTIPQDWAIGADGEPTIDPAHALAGALLPIAGHKGVGLAMMVQILAGSLTASATAESAARHSASSSAGNVSAFILVLNPDLVIGADNYAAHVENWMKAYRTAMGKSALYPGERSHAAELVRSRDGIPLSLNVVEELKGVGALTGISFDPLLSQGAQL